MQNTPIKNAIKECMALSNNFMDYVKKELKKHKIKYEEKSDYEVVVPSGTKEGIIDVLLKNDNINKKNINILLQITELNGKVSIRQKSN